MANQPISKTLTSSDGTIIYADAVGNPLKAHIVFVHGFSLCAAVFDKIFNNTKFQEMFFLVRYDMRGHDRSGKPETDDGYASKLYADDFAAVMEAFLLVRPVFVGWSLGASVAVDITTYLPPNTLSGIVYLSGLLRTKAFELSTPYTFKYGSILSDPEASAEAIEAAALAFSDGIFDLRSALESTSEADLRARRTRRWDVQSAWIGYIGQLTARHRRFLTYRDQDSSALFALGSEGFPVLVVQGVQDALVETHAVVEESKRRFKNLKVSLIEDGNHALFHDKPDEVMEYIGGFVNEVWINVH